MPIEVRKRTVKATIELTDLFSDDEIHVYLNAKIIAAGKSDYQDYQILETKSAGKMLIIDNSMQSCERDEHFYHEPLVHVPIALATPRFPQPSPAVAQYMAGINDFSVLVLGGGEGATIREVVKWPFVKDVLMIDIDQDLVDACIDHLQWDDGAFDDHRVNYIAGDALKFIEKRDQRFDVVIADLTDPEGGVQNSLFYTTEFYQKIKDNVLKPSGVFCTQTGGLQFNVYYKETLANARKVWPEAYAFASFVPSFYEVWGFIVAGGLRYCPKSPGVKYDCVSQPCFHLFDHMQQWLQIVEEKNKAVKSSSPALLFEMPNYVEHARLDVDVENKK